MKYDVINRCFVKLMKPEKFGDVRTSPEEEPDRSLFALRKLALAIYTVTENHIETPIIWADLVEPRKTNSTPDPINTNLTPVAALYPDLRVVLNYFREEKPDIANSPEIKTDLERFEFRAKCGALKKANEISGVTDYEMTMNNGASAVIVYLYDVGDLAKYIKDQESLKTYLNLVKKPDISSIQNPTLLAFMGYADEAVDYMQKVLKPSEKSFPEQIIAAKEPPNTGRFLGGKT